MEQAKLVEAPQSKVAENLEGGMTLTDDRTGDEVELLFIDEHSALIRRERTDRDFGGRDGPETSVTNRETFIDAVEAGRYVINDND